MHVVVTAGHVDHGKSSLVRALTGTDPDRLPEEHQRGLTIELGYAWTALPGAGDVAFVDVPGHERFVPTTLAGMGSVPVALLVVAADDPWMPQAAEHLAALDALGVSRGLVAVSRADLADPGPAAERARAELARTSLAGAPVLPVSSTTGAGLTELRGALATVLRDVPSPDAETDVRLWVDRRFTVRGAGTVVTGTLPAGRVRPGDRLEHEGGTVRVRGMQSLGREVPEAVGVARVALNLTGETEAIDRGSVLVTPGAWQHAETVDVLLIPAFGEGRSGSARFTTARSPRPPERPLLHIGSAAVSVHHRPLGSPLREEHGSLPPADQPAMAPRLARLRLDRPLPLRIGDRALLRDPGSRALWGARVLDPAPPGLGRRGAAARRATVLAELDGEPDPAAEVARREVVELDLVRRLTGPLPPPETLGVAAAGVVVSAERAARAAAEATRIVREHQEAEPLAPGMSAAALADRLHLPEPVLRALLPTSLRLHDGRVLAGPAPGLPAPVERALATLGEDFAAAPFSAPTADRLRELGLDERALAAAARASRLLRPAPGIVLPADAADRAVEILAGLPQPFTTSEARQALGTSRRVVLPLLDHLDRRRLTRRLSDDRRELRRPEFR